MRDYEIALLRAIATDPAEHPWAPDHAERLGIPAKRADYIYEKWSRKDWWDYGVTARSGWLTEKGKQQAKAQP